MKIFWDESFVEYDSVCVYSIRMMYFVVRVCVCVCVYTFVHMYVAYVVCVHALDSSLSFYILYREEKSLYAILELEKDAKPEQIKKSYRKVNNM